MNQILICEVTMEREGWDMTLKCLGLMSNVRRVLLAVKHDGREIGGIIGDKRRNSGNPM